MTWSHRIHQQLPTLKTFFRRRRRSSTGSSKSSVSPTNNVATTTATAVVAPEARPPLPPLPPVASLTVSTTAATTTTMTTTTTSSPGSPSSPEQPASPPPPPSSLSLASHETLPPQGWAKLVLRSSYTDSSVMREQLEGMLGRDNFNFKLRNGRYIIHSIRPLTKDEIDVLQRAMYQHYIEQLGYDDDDDEDEAAGYP